MRKSAKILRRLINCCRVPHNSMEQRAVAGLEELLRKKKKILRGEEEAPYLGICLHFGLPLEWRRVVFNNWRHFSGDPFYPVFDPIDSQYKTPAQQYVKLPRYTGRYGKMRFKLAEHTLKALKKDLKTLKSMGLI